jgi:hypothetical protein
MQKTTERGASQPVIHEISNSHQEGREEWHVKAQKKWRMQTAQEDRFLGSWFRAS